MTTPESRAFFIRLAVLSLAALTLASPARAADPPERGLSAAFNYPGLVLGLDEPVELPLTIRNLGRADDSFLVTVTDRPAGWETEIRSFSTVVTGLFLPGLDQAGLTLTASPPEGARPAPGDYRFTVRVASLDGRLHQELEARVTLRTRSTGRPALAVSTAYPEVRGPSDGRFSFSLEVRNQGDEDGLVGLSASVPEGWEAYFKPSYEDKQISSLQIPKGQSRSLTLDIKPGFRAGIGSHPVTVRAESKWGTAEAALTVDLTGTYQIRLIPANELLSAATEPGKPVSLGFFVLNEGSAPQREVKFITVAPDNWKVEFEPPVLTDLAPGRTPTPLTLTVTPAEEALAGDYAVGVAAEGERTKSPLDLRITVRAKAVWAGAGVALIILVVLGLALTFRRLGRR